MLSRSFCLRAVPRTAALLLAIASVAHPARAQFPCEPMNTQVVVPGYVSLAATVTVTCSGNGAHVKVQWPFDDPSPAAWLNEYVYNASAATVDITVGGQWLATIGFVPNNEPNANTRYLITGCPEIYGGTGAAVPWNDACVQKLRNRIYPDFWIMKRVILQIPNPGAQAIAQAMRPLFGEGGPAGPGAGHQGSPADDVGQGVGPIRPPKTIFPGGTGTSLDPTGDASDGLTPGVPQTTSPASPPTKPKAGASQKSPFPSVPSSPLDDLEKASPPR